MGQFRQGCGQRDGLKLFTVKERLGADLLKTFRKSYAFKGVTTFKRRFSDALQPLGKHYAYNTATMLEGARADDSKRCREIYLLVLERGASGECVVTDRLKSVCKGYLCKCLALLEGVSAY